MHRRGDAHVLNEAGTGDVHVQPEQMGMALNGDKVMVEQAQPRAARNGRTPRPGASPEGRIIKIVERAKMVMVGELFEKNGRWFVKADDPRLPREVSVKPEKGTPHTEWKTNYKVVVRLDFGASKPDLWRGFVVEVLGAADAPGVDMLGIVRRYDLPTEFPADVVAEADAYSDVVSAEEIARREDLREQFIVTIDPDDAKDFDDAIHVEQLKNGGWRLGVHIADVSHYVKPGTALDREAFARGNSVYLADRVIPMLPESLSNGICSLKPQVERLVFSVFIDFDQAADVQKTRFGRSVIRSAARLTYRQALAILEDETPPPTPNYERGGQVHLDAKPIPLVVTPELRERVQTAWQLASLLRKKRFAAGSLDLDFPEVKIWLDDQGRAARLERLENDISHQLIEEFMLVANEVVASETKQKLRPNIYRVHEKPDPAKLVEYREFAQSHGFRCGDLTLRSEVQKLLASIKGTPEEHAVKTAFLRSLKRAIYSTEPLGHYGLAKENYTHFTSPIRRYADLVVHRVLASTKKQEHVTAKPLPVVAEHISRTERVAADAERDSTRLKKTEFFANQLAAKPPQAFRAVVVEVRNFGLIIDLPDCQQGGMVHVSDLGQDYFTYDSVRQRFIGRKSERTYQMGTMIEVFVSRVDLEKMDVDFKIAELQSGEKCGGHAKTPLQKLPSRSNRRPRK